MVSKLDDYLKFNETAMSLRSYRQQLLASNIANGDTPHFKARDIDFSAKLNEKLGRAAPGQAADVGKLPMTKTSAAHMPPLALEMTSTKHLQGVVEENPAKKDEPLYRDVVQGSVDGNTVDMDVERNNFMDNALRYQFGVTSVTSQIKGMLTAIQSN